MSYYFNDSIFWIDVEKIHPNPFQPRKDFDPAQLQSLSDSIKQYGVLQALVVTRKEVEKEDGGLETQYELIAGERRLRASKLAGLQQVPVLIKTGEETDLMKLELAIIENIQREDLNPIDRAKAFEKLANEFGFKHMEIARKVGKSREYVSNSIRILTLPPEILDALSKGQISEGHTRPLLMIGDRPDEQRVLFKEIVVKKLTVREAEAVSRKIAYDKVRKKEYEFDPELADLEEKIAASLGTRVSIERKDHGGKLMIDFFSNDDLYGIFELLKKNHAAAPMNPDALLDKHVAAKVAHGGGEAMLGGADYPAAQAPSQQVPLQDAMDTVPTTLAPEIIPTPAEIAAETVPAEFIDDRTPVQKEQDENTDDMYSVTNFSL